MKNRSYRTAAPRRASLTAGLALALGGCAVTSHDSAPATLGRPSSTSHMESLLSTPGPVVLEKVVAADWQVPLSGMLNLDHPRAVEAGLTDRPEPIHIYAFAVRHPERGLFLIDSGVARGIADGTSEVLSFVVKQGLGTDDLKVRTDTARWLAAQPDPLRGVFLTHLHLDHILGVPDIPANVPIYTGPGEPHGRRLLNLVTQGTTDRALEGHGALRELDTEPDPDGEIAFVHDLFGDGSVFALGVPGHTAGSTAFVVRTTGGPVLLTGDASHTSWGFAHGVEPGTFNEHPDRAAESLAALRALAARHPELRVQPGHQSFPEPVGVALHAPRR
jgi:glyoxylase-like metal-dependent hydrolase (beta-lactamase superfamily II)